VIAGGAYSSGTVKGITECSGKEGREKEAEDILSGACAEAEAEAEGGDNLTRVRIRGWLPGKTTVTLGVMMELGYIRSYLYVVYIAKCSDYYL